MDIRKQSKIMQLPLDAIEPSPYQARTTFDETEIAALAVSILQNGLLQPISVRRVGLRKYQLVAGERRLRACKLAKLEKVPALLAEYDDSESAALGLLENIQRSQLDPFDTARGIREVIRLWGCTQAEAARRLGLSQPALANKLRLLTLTDEQQKICTDGHLTERHARAALRLPESRRTAALEKMARDKLSVRQADKLVEGMLANPTAPSPCRKTIPMVRDVRLFVNTLQHAVDLMTQKGIAATTSCDKREDCWEYVVRIPVNRDASGVPVMPPLDETAAAQLMQADAGDSGILNGPLVGRGDGTAAGAGARAAQEGGAAKAQAQPGQSGIVVAAVREAQEGSTGKAGAREVQGDGAAKPGVQAAVRPSRPVQAAQGAPQNAHPAPVQHIAGRKPVGKIRLEDGVIVREEPPLPQPPAYPPVFAAALGAPQTVPFSHTSASAATQDLQAAAQQDARAASTQEDFSIRLL